MSLVFMTKARPSKCLVLAKLKINKSKSKKRQTLEAEYVRDFVGYVNFFAKQSKSQILNKEKQQQQQQLPLFTCKHPAPRIESGAKQSCSSHSQEVKQVK